MQDITGIIDELMSFGMPKERAISLTLQLINAGEQAVFARLGELGGKRAIDDRDLSLFVATLIAA